MAQPAYAQKSFNYKNDFNKILLRTKDTGDSLAYDKLLQRFKANDTTLTDFEVLALLIGFTDKPQYKPYNNLSTERYIYRLNGEGKFREGLDSANAFLKTHPLSVKTIYEKSYSFYKLQQQDSSNHYSYQGLRIFKAMFYSGIGNAPDKPSFALGPADGQDYIRKFLRADIGTMGSGRDDNGHFLDILEAKFDDDQTVTLYFIIQHATDKMFSGKSAKEEIERQKKK